MEQRSLKILDTNKTFFSKITSTITKILIPTRVSINGIMISIKRNNLIKAYTNYLLNASEETNKKEIAIKKYEDTYALYLEAIDKYIMDSLYKKVKSNTASSFERDALSKYYLIVSLKDKQYVEYKHRKQEYLIRVDYENVVNSSKESFLKKYNGFYVSKMDSLYKGLLKNYSIRLADNIKSNEEEQIYRKIFETIEDYINEIFTIKLKNPEIKDEYQNVQEDYDKYEHAIIGKLDEIDKIKKKTILLGISRQLFTHSLPLSAAEQCYSKLMKETRNLIVNEKNKKKKEKLIELLVYILEEYNLKLLSTKIYWDKPAEREEYKKFWDNYKAISQEKDKNKKIILFLKYDLKQLNKSSKRQNAKIVSIIKNKLTELGAMRRFKNSCRTAHQYVKVKGNQ